MTTEAFTYEEEFGPDERYRIWQRGSRNPDGSTKNTLIATCPSAEAVGVALVQLAEDRAEAGTYHAPIIGVLDSENGRWITSLWPGRGLL